MRELDVKGKTCDACGSIMVGCFHAADGFKLKHWLCLVCGEEDRAIGRERMIEPGDIDGSEDNRQHDKAADS